MSSQPQPEFAVGDVVIDVHNGRKGTVLSYKWQPVLKSYSCKYNCEYETDKLQEPRSDTVWVKVDEYPRWALDFTLEAAVKNPGSSQEGGAQP